MAMCFGGRQHWLRQMSANLVIFCGSPERMTIREIFGTGKNTALSGCWRSDIEGGVKVAGRNEQKRA
jgi:hypothetical protein